MKNLELKLFIFILSISLTSCSLIEPDEAKVSFTFRPKNQKINIEMLRLFFTDNNKIIFLTAKDFTEATGYVKSTKAYSTKMSGLLYIEFNFTTSDNDTTSKGNFTIPLKSDWHWGVDIFVANRNPMEDCFGCFGYKAFAIKPVYKDSLSDSVYVVWGGNSIKNPVIY